jgi:DNA-directed RNA polymerase subunit RPC12/RpoP
MVLCPACGSDRLIPLTFGSVLGNDRTDLTRRPVAKCADCGERTYVTAKAHRALSSL